MVPAIMIICGIGIAGIWTADIISGKQINIKNGLFKARDPESNSLMWPHWIAEYSTAFALIFGAIGLIVEKTWAIHISFIALGALAYTSLNSLSWALAKKERLRYVIPMVISIAGVCISLTGLL
jgi:hypothetical protein